MSNSELIRAARTTPVTHLTDTEAILDMKKLRAYRLGRLQAELARRDYGAACSTIRSPFATPPATGISRCCRCTFPAPTCSCRRQVR